MIITNEQQIFSLQEIDFGDLENLRFWKNKHRNRFFHKEVITQEQQAKWFESYLNDEESKMFVVRLGVEAIGCMGYRIKDNIIDVYNIMRGVETKCDLFTMTDAFQLMLNFIKDKYQRKISCVVLNDNPAFSWYLKNEFVVKDKYETYSFLEHNPKRYLNNFIVKES